MPTVIEPQPAAAYPLTKDQSWHTPSLAWAYGRALLFAVVGGTLVGLLAAGVGRYVGVAVVVLLAAGYAWWARSTNPKVMQQRILRADPWVVYEAHVTRTAPTKLGDTRVEFTDAQGRERTYQVAPNDPNFQLGQRSIWFAGTPGDRLAVISLREGVCTGLAATGFQSTLLPKPATAEEGPQPTHSRPVTDGPAIEHPVTREQPLPAGRSLIAGFVAVVLLVLGITGGGRLHGVNGWSGLVLLLLTLLSAAYFVFWTGRRQTRSLLRKHPWVEYPATVSEAGPFRNGAKASVAITADDGRTFSYRTYPARTDYQLGARPVWLAGRPGDRVVVVSLEEGGCVSRAGLTPVEELVPGRGTAGPAAH